MTLPLAEMTLNDLRTLIREEIQRLYAAGTSEIPPSPNAWTPQQALYIRGQLAAFIDGWEDSALDVYDETR